MTDSSGNIQTFEFDLGYDVLMSVNGAADVRDGNIFRLTQGATTRTFEFDSGKVLVFGGIAPANDEITIRGLNTATNVLEDRTITIGAGDPVVGGTAAAVAAAINALADFAPDAVAIGDRVSILNDVNVTLSPLNSGVITIEGDYGLTTAGAVGITFEESDATSVLGNQIVTRVAADFFNERVAYGQRSANLQFGDRLTFNNFNNADFSGTPSFYHVVSDLGASQPGLYNAGNHIIVLDADDINTVVATTVANAINANAVLTVQATAQGGQVALTNVG